MLNNVKERIKMRKKFLVILFCLCLVLSGCDDSSNNVSTAMTDELSIDMTTKANIPAQYTEPTKDIQQSTTEAEINEASIPEKPNSISSVQDHNGDTPESLEMENEVDDEESLCGIIAMVVDYTNDWQCTIYCIDPETGSQRKISHFEVYTGMQYFPDVKVATTYVPGDWYYEQLYDSLVSFADDYTKLAVTKVVSRSKGESHAGWIDQSGNFFDVTEAVGNVVHDEFKSAVIEYAVGFVNGGKDFVFYHDTRSEFRTDQYIVPCNNASSETVSLFRDMEIEEWLFINSSYEMDRILQLNHLRGDGERITDVIDENSYLYDKSNGINTRQIIYSSVNHKKGTSGRYELIPSEARSNWGAVASPDGTQIAFISAAHTESDQSIFVGDLNNNVLENAHRINSNLPESKTITGEICYESSCPNVFCTLLDWR